MEGALFSVPSLSELLPARHATPLVKDVLGLTRREEICSQRGHDDIGISLHPSKH